MIDFLKGTVTPQDWAAVSGIVGVTLAIAFAFYFFVYTNQMETLAEIENQNLQVSEDLKLARQQEANIEDLREKTARIEDLVTDFEQRLPTTREIPTLVREFERMAGDENVNIEELTDLPRNRDENKETIPYSVRARGSFHQITAFINRLERFRRYLKITDLHIGPEEKGITTASFTLNTYRFLKSQEDSSQ